MATLIDRAALELATPLGAVHVIGPEGPVPFSVVRHDSDEYGQLNTVTRDGVTLGITAYNPSENCWDWPEGSSGSIPRDYDILWDEPTKHEFTLVRCPEGDKYENAMVYVAWQPTANDAEADAAETDMFVLMM